MIVLWKTQFPSFWNMSDCTNCRTSIWKNSFTSRPICIMSAEARKSCTFLVFRETRHKRNYLGLTISNMIKNFKARSCFLGTRLVKAGCYGELWNGALNIHMGEEGDLPLFHISVLTLLNVTSSFLDSVVSNEFHYQMVRRGNFKMRFLTLSSFSWQSERDNIVIKQKWPENIAMTWNPNRLAIQVWRSHLIK